MSVRLEYALALGTNLGDKTAHLKRALDFLNSGPFSLGRVSGFYETSPWGFESHHAFMNACVQVYTPLTPAQVLENVKAFERSMGRIKKEGEGYTDRVIDIDLLFCGQTVYNTMNLTLPHPHLHQRAFVLRPLMDIYPDWKHPVLKKTVREMMKEMSSGQ